VHKEVERFMCGIGLATNESLTGCLDTCQPIGRSDGDVEGSGVTDGDDGNLIVGWQPEEELGWDGVDRTVEGGEVDFDA
jgi:hypothetical protein